MARTGKRYDQEFKDQVVARCLAEGQSLGSTAKDFGVSEQTLRNWINRGKNKSETDIRLLQLEAENRQLKRRLSDVEETNEILKKATAIFATTNRK